MPFSSCLCRRCPRLLVLLVTLLALAPPAQADLIGELIDPEQLWVEEGIDILSAQIEQTGGWLTFSIQTRGDIPTVLPNPDDVITFLWLVDTDENNATGQPHGPIGSEFNVRATIGESFGGGFVDITGSEPGGGLAEVTVAGDLITIEVGLPQIAAPADFNWICSSFHVENGSWVSGNPESGVASAVTLPYAPPARVTITTPILQLCPGGPSTGQLQVMLQDINGDQLPVGDYRLDFQITGEDVATVDDTGLVTAVAPPGEFSQTPYILVSADGRNSDNSAVIRVTDIDLGVVHHAYAAEHVSFFLPDVIEGVDLGALTWQFEIPAATDMAYVAETEVIGAAPFGGGHHYFALDVSNDPANTPCGISGSPVRLGWNWGQPGHNSCYIVNEPGNRRPHWFVFWHEMGHNFTFVSTGFGQFCAGPSGQHNFTYIEGLASLAAMWAWKSVLGAPGSLGPTALDDIGAKFDGYETHFRWRLGQYQGAGAVYDTIDPDIIDGILMEMYDTYGVKPWYELFSTFLPADEPLPLTIDTRDKQATWIVAAFSVSAGEDLRPLFTTSYGFPFDASAWPGIYSAVEARIANRPYQPLAAEGKPAPRSGTLSFSPNPFHPRTEIRYVTTETGRVQLAIHDVRGRRVATLLDELVPPGDHTLVWDGRDDRGRAVAAGAYIARLTTAEGERTTKVTLLK